MIRYTMQFNLVSYSDSDEETSTESNLASGDVSSEGRGSSRDIEVVTKPNKRKSNGRDPSPDTCTAPKRTKGRAAGPLPLPDTIRSLYTDKSGEHQDDASKHGGRIRTFEHEEGSWATHVHIPCEPDARFDDLVTELLLCLRPAEFHPMENFHISLSRTVSVRHHWIKALTDSFQARAHTLQRCYCEIQSVKLYTNDEKNRTFVALEVESHPPVLREYTKAVDVCFVEYGLQPYYKNPSFHVSIGWCLGDVISDVKSTHRQQLQEVLERHLQANSDLRLIPVDRIQCVTGNKSFYFPLGT